MSKIILWISDMNSKKRIKHTIRHFTEVQNKSQKVITLINIMPLPMSEKGAETSLKRKETEGQVLKYGINEKIF